MALSAPTVQEIVTTQQIIEHPALVKEESYVIASTSQGAVAVVNLQGKTDAGEWNEATTISQTFIQDFPASGTEGQPDYLPPRSVIRTAQGEFTLNNEQIADDINAMRLSAVIANIPQATKYNAVGMPFVEAGIAVNAYITAQIEAQLQAQQG